VTQGSPSFNLLDEPFIGVIPVGGNGLHEVGIRDLLSKAHEYERIHSDSPLEIVAISRLLFAVLHCVHRSIDADVWSELWQRGCFDMEPIQKYLSTVHSRFELFSETQPFYQAPQLPIPRDKLSPSQRLCQELASGSNAVLFDHSHDAQPLAMTPSRAARSLIATQAFAISGGQSAEKLGYTTDAPLVGKAVLIPIAKTVFASLMLGILSDSNIRDMFGHLGTAWWERTQCGLPHEHNKDPDGYLDYLTWQSRAVLLYPNNIGGDWQVQQVAYALGRELDSVHEDPFVAYSRKSKLDKWRPLRVSREKELWRDSGSFFAISSPDQNERRPQILNWLARLNLRGRLNHTDRLRLCGIGYDNVSDKGKPDANVHLWQKAELPLPLQLLDDASLIIAVRAGIDFAETAHKALRQAVWVMARWHLSLDYEQLSPKKRKQIDNKIQQVIKSINPSRRFWSAIEPMFDRFMHDLPSNRGAAMEAWKRSLITTARQLFTSIANSGVVTARDLQAMAQAGRTLEFKLQELKENFT